MFSSITESPAFRHAEYNSAFVLTEYFGYLPRDPDASGFAFLLDVLNNHATADYRAVVCAFINSLEYQRRFSSVVTRSDGECGS